VDKLRVATLNIWNRQGPWSRRIALIRRGIDALAPDILGLQEVLRDADGSLDQAREIGTGLAYNVAFGEAEDLGVVGSFGNALLSRFPIAEHRAIALPGRAESGEARSVLHARIDAPFGPVSVFITHLNWKLHHGWVRLRQVRFLVDLMRDLAPPASDAFPPILLGDLNAEPESDEIRYLRGLATVDGRSVYFADAWTYGAPPGDAGPTYDGQRNGFAAVAREPPRRIDYILVRREPGPFRGEPLEARLAFTEPTAFGEAGEVWPSDHFGVVADLAVEAATTEAETASV
jgi:endonuclease/exonuclease/phosphatase family metal-dependent hydrolase